MNGNAVVYCAVNAEHMNLYGIWMAKVCICCICVCVRAVSSVHGSRCPWKKVARYNYNNVRFFALSVLSSFHEYCRSRQVKAMVDRINYVRWVTAYFLSMCISMMVLYINRLEYLCSVRVFAQRALVDVSNTRKISHISRNGSCTFPLPLLIDFFSFPFFSFADGPVSTPLYSLRKILQLIWAHDTLESH